MPFYPHICTNCNYEWEDFYGMTSPIPDTCPNCKSVGTVKRTISSQISIKVELGWYEKKKQIEKERKELKTKFDKDENLRANVLGEDKYNEQLKASENMIKDLKNL